MGSGVSKYSYLYSNAISKRVQYAERFLGYVDAWLRLLFGGKVNWGRKEKTNPRRCGTTVLTLLLALRQVLAIHSENPEFQPILFIVISVMLPLQFSMNLLTFSVL